MFKNQSSYYLAWLEWQQPPRQHRHLKLQQLLRLIGQRKEEQPWYKYTFITWTISGEPRSYQRQIKDLGDEHNREKIYALPKKILPLEHNRKEGAEYLIIWFIRCICPLCPTAVLVFVNCEIWMVLHKF